MRIILILCLMLCFGQSAKQIQELTSGENWGQFTQIMEAKDEHANIPAQYYICGFDFLEKKWTKALRNCRCRRPWYQSWRVRCSLCDNKFWTRAAAVAIVFCSPNNWNDQIVKRFNTGSAETRNWRGPRMCPINTFATGFQGKYGATHGVKLGLHGMLMRCTSLDYKGSQDIQDNQAYPSHFFAAKFGLFLSSFKVKYEPGGMLTGINMYAEGMPIINSLKIDYNVTAGFENYPVVIDIQKIINDGRQTAQKKVSFSKTYETTGQWNSNNPEIKGYPMLSNLTIPPPNLMNSDAGANSLYKSTTSQFGFENPVKTVLSSNQEIVVFVTAGFEALISSTVQEQKGSVPYKAYLTLVNRVTGDKILDYVVTGNWQGVTTGSVETKITQTAIKKAEDASNDSQPQAQDKPNLRK